MFSATFYQKSLPSHSRAQGLAALALVLLSIVHPLQIFNEGYQEEDEDKAYSDEDQDSSLHTFILLKSSIDLLCFPL